MYNVLIVHVIEPETLYSASEDIAILHVGMSLEGNILATVIGHLDNNPILYCWKNIHWNMQFVIMVLVSSLR